MLRPATRFTRAFGEVLREKREKAKPEKISQEALGLKSGVHPTLVSQIERGVTIPSLRTVELLAAALDVPIYRLIKSAEDRARRARR
jgi:transcriptional regulator with XRE-family HTH domain